MKNETKDLEKGYSNTTYLVERLLKEKSNKVIEEFLDIDDFMNDCVFEMNSVASLKELKSKPSRNNYTDIKTSNRFLEMLSQLNYYIECCSIIQGYILNNGVDKNSFSVALNTLSKNIQYCSKLKWKLLESTAEKNIRLNKHTNLFSSK